MGINVHTTQASVHMQGQDLRVEVHRAPAELDTDPSIATARLDLEGGGKLPHRIDLEGTHAQLRAVAREILDVLPEDEQPDDGGMVAS